VKTKFANVVLTSGGAVTCVALLIYLRSRYWTHTHLQASGEVIAALAALATISFASLTLPRRARTAVAVSYVLLTVGVYGVELAGTFGYTAARVHAVGIDGLTVDEKLELQQMARKDGFSLDLRTRADVLAELSARHIDAVPAVLLADVQGPNLQPGQPDPLHLMPVGGISNARTVLCNQSGQYVIYQSDEHGFRNPPGIWNTTQADIAVVGQSYAQGYCVPDGKTFGDLLRSDHHVVLNLGQSGDSALLLLASIKEYLSRYKPRSVLWVFAEGIDLADLRDAATHPFLMQYLDPSFTQHLFTRQAEIDQLLRHATVDAGNRRETGRSPERRSLRQTATEIAKLWNVRQEIALIYGITSGDENVWQPQQKEYDLLGQTLRQAKAEVSTWGGALYFVYLPTWSRYRNGPIVNEPEHLRTLEVVRSLDIPAIDVEPAFRAEADPLSLFPFRRFLHYNERGNEIVAQTVHGFLSSRTHRN